ncbi:ATP-binding protein [Myroides sp. C8-3]|uniref:sensor histidine kinase n=1 Tax=Myroides sp. C8-3 TaxID=3400533 RepID=UPI003D2F7475
MTYKKRLYSLYLLVSSLLLLSSSCQHKQSQHQTDLDNLYAFKRTTVQKDSISKKYEAAVAALLQSKDQPREEVDRLLDRMRWSSNTNAFFALSDLAERQAVKQKDYTRLADIYENIAVFYHDNQQLDSVYAYYLKAERFYGKSGDSLGLAENIYYQARLLYEVGFHKESENKLYQALKLLKKTPDHPIHIEANQLKTFYTTDLFNNPQALQTMLDTYETLKKDEGRYATLPEKKYNMAMSNLLGNIALYYEELNQLEKAETFALQALEYYHKSSAPKQLFAHLHTTYHLTRYQQGKEEDIIARLLESYEIYNKLNHPFYSVDICGHIADIYLDLGQRAASLHWLKKAYDLTDENNLYTKKKAILQKLLLFHADQQTAELIKEFVDLSALLEDTHLETKGKFAKIEYNSFLLEQENETLKQKIYLIYLSAFIVIGSLLFFLLWFRLKSKNRELIHTNSEKSKNERILNLLIENNTIENDTILKERNRIAKDLHDGVINSIFTLRFNTQLLEIPNKTLKSMLVDELVNLENTIREISHSFSQKNRFQNKSFENLLSELVNKQKNKNKTVFSFSIENQLCLEQLTTLQKVNIYQIIQEAFQNVNKHAQASSCQLRVYTDAYHLYFEVKDNGLGIGKSIHRGIGLTNMKERAELIDAVLQIHSNPKQGTTILLQLDN